MDDGGGRKPIGLVTDNPALSRQPMLGEIYFIERALAPNHEVRADRLQTLLKQELAVIVLTDHSTFGEGDRDGPARLGREAAAWWCASPARSWRASPTDDLLPVRLRPGDRTLGGALVVDRAGAPGRVPELIAVRRACRCRRMSRSSARCWRSPTSTLATRPGRG